MLWSECSFFFFSYLYVFERVTGLTHAHALLEGLSTAPFTPRCHSFPLLCEFFPSPVDPRGPKTKKKEKKKRENPAVYVHFLSVLIVWGETWTVIPAENNTSFSPVKPSVRPHHREQALRIHDIISLPGKVAHSIFPTTLCCVEVLQRG